MKEGFLKKIKRKDKNCFLALDIGTEAVKALIFKKEGEKIFVLDSDLQYFDRDLQDRVFPETASRIANALKEKTKKDPGSVFLSLSPDILRSRTVSVSFSKEKEKPLKGLEEKRIVESVLKKAEEKIAGKFSEESGILPHELEFLEKKILNIKINGYQVPRLSGYKGKDLEFEVLADFIPKHYLEKFKKRTAGLKVSGICHQAHKLAEVLKERQAVFLDVGGEITQFFLLKNGSLKMVSEFEIGGETFDRALSETLGLPRERARILKEKYSAKSLGEQTRERVREIFSRPLEQWNENFSRVLAKFKGLPPSRIFLSGGGSRLPEIAEALESRDFYLKPLPSGVFGDISGKSHILKNPQYFNLLFCLIHE